MVKTNEYRIRSKINHEVNKNPSKDDRASNNKLSLLIVFIDISQRKSRVDLRYHDQEGKKGREKEKKRQP